MGLLDGLFSDDPKQQAMMAMAMGLLGNQSGNFGKDVGHAGLLGQQAYAIGNDRKQKALQEEQQRQMRDMQMAQMKQAMEDQQFAQQQAPQFFSPGNAPADGTGPVMPPKADLSGYGMALAQRNPTMGMPFIQAGMKDTSPITVKAGETLLDRTTLQPKFTAPDKPHWVDAGDKMIPVGNDGKPIGPPIPKNLGPGEAQRLGIEGARLGLERGRYNYEVGNGQGLPQKAIDAIGLDVGKKRAEAQVQAQSDLPALAAEAQQTLGLVDKLVTHPGFSGTVGAKNVTGAFAAAGKPIPGTQAADFMALRDQIVGKQFMQAYQNLKGGGQITEVEGKKATDAIARMNTAQTERAFTEAANEFKQVIQAGLSRAQAKAGGEQLPVGTPKVGTVDGGFYFKGGNPADPNSWVKMR